MNSARDTPASRAARVSSRMMSGASAMAVVFLGAGAMEAIVKRKARGASMAASAATCREGVMPGLSEARPGELPAA